MCSDDDIKARYNAWASRRLFVVPQDAPEQPQALSERGVSSATQSPAKHLNVLRSPAAMAWAGRQLFAVLRP